MRIIASLGFCSVVLLTASAVAAPPVACGSTEFADWKQWMQNWLDAGNEKEYYRNPCGGRSTMGPRMPADFEVPLEVDWASFEKAYDMMDAKGQRWMTTRFNLASYCGGFWSGLSHFGSSNSADAATTKKVRRGVTKAVCYVEPGGPKEAKYELITQGKNKGVFMMRVSSRASNIDRNVADEIRTKLKL